MTRLVCVTLVLTAGFVSAQTREPPVASARSGPPAIFLSPIMPPGLKLLSQPAVQTDVGLSAEQKAEVVALNQLWGQSLNTWEVVWVTPEMARALIARRTEEFLTKSLTKEQRTRLDQIVFQLREKEFGAHAAFAMAARDLGLRSDQLEDLQNLKGLRVEEITKHVVSGERYEKVKAKVTATNGETFEKMAEMLTRTQRERLKELKGKPFVGHAEATTDLAGATGDAARPKFPAHLFGRYDLELRYLGDPSIRKELRLSEDQAVRLDGGLRVWNIERVDTKGDWEKLHELTERVLGHLTPVQRTRFDQIMLQRRERAGPEVMCGHPAAVAALKLSPVQLQQLRDGKPVKDVLTRDQMTNREKLLGPPFELPKVDDPILSVPAVATANVPDFAFARSFLFFADRLKLSADQTKKLRDLADDEPKFKDLIRRELSLVETLPFAGSTRSMTVDRAVMDKYQAAVEEQCWSVLDAQQQSLARKIFGRGGR